MEFSCSITWLLPSPRICRSLVSRSTLRRYICVHSCLTPKITESPPILLPNYDS